MWEMILAASIVVLVFLFLFLAVSSFLNSNGVIERTNNKIKVIK